MYEVRGSCPPAANRVSTDKGWREGARAQALYFCGDWRGYRYIQAEKMNERKMTTFFGRYLFENPPKETRVYELKFTASKSIRFDALSEHQRDAMKQAESVGLYHRITDQPWIKDRPRAYTLKKPFDCFFVKCRAYVVVWFYKPRKQKVFYAIRIMDFLAMEASTERKSFTEDMARECYSDLLEIS